VRQAGWCRRYTLLSACVVWLLFCGMADFSVEAGAQHKRVEPSWELTGQFSGLVMEKAFGSQGNLILKSLSLKGVRIKAQAGRTQQPYFRTLPNGRLMLGLAAANRYAEMPLCTCRIPVKSEPKDASTWVLPGESSIRAAGPLPGFGSAFDVPCRLAGAGTGYRDVWEFIDQQGPYCTWFSLGAEHVFLTRAKLLGFDFAPDPTYPLTFKFTRNGYVHLCGKGEVVAPDGSRRSLGRDDTIEKWVPLLQSKDVLLREGASQALGWLAVTKEQKDKALPPLVGALKDSASEVRRNAAEALGKIGDSAASEGLRGLLQAEQYGWVFDVAEESLSKVQ